MASPTARPRRLGASAWTLLTLALAVVLGLLLHIGLGSSDSGHFFSLRLSPSEVLRELFRGDVGGDPSNSIVWRIRLPRALACVLAGGILGTVGSAFQAMFRNPLADPYIVGVSSGAAVGGAASILLGFAGWASGLGLMASAFACGFASLGLVFALARRPTGVDVSTLLLAGVVVGSMLTSILALLLYAANQDANQILRWMLGSATPMSWERVAAMSVALFLGGAVLLIQTKRLNAFAVSEDSAKRLGVDTRRLKATVLVWGTGMAAVVVGSMGVIGFLGLVSPHIARRLIGVDWRWSLAASGLVGSALLLLSDVIAQWGMPGGELPVGVITALLGAPFLIALMRRAPV